MDLLQKRMRPWPAFREQTHCQVKDMSTHVSLVFDLVPWTNQWKEKFRGEYATNEKKFPSLKRKGKSVPDIRTA